MLERPARYKQSSSLQKFVNSSRKKYYNIGPSKKPKKKFVNTFTHLELERFPMKQRILKIVNNCFNTNIYSYLETSGGQS
jgi:hypothetical protein